MTIPSFRPRGTLAVQENGRIVASTEFLRWLDLLTRQVTGSAEVVEGGASVAGTSYAAMDANSVSASAVAAAYGEQPDSAPAGTDYEAPASDMDTVQYAPTVALVTY